MDSLFSTDSMDGWDRIGDIIWPRHGRNARVTKFFVGPPKVVWKIRPVLCSVCLEKFKNIFFSKKEKNLLFVHGDKIF